MVVTTYTPMEDVADEEKDEFYQQYQDELHSIPRRDIMLLMGVINVQIDGNR